MLWEVAENLKKWKYIDTTRGTTITCDLQCAHRRLLKRSVLNHASDDERPWSGIVLRYSIKIMEITWLECSELHNRSHFKLYYLKKCCHSFAAIAKTCVPVHQSFIFILHKNICVTEQTLENEPSSMSFFSGFSPSAPDCTLPNHYFASVHKRKINWVNLDFIATKMFCVPVHKIFQQIGIRDRSCCVSNVKSRRHSGRHQLDFFQTLLGCWWIHSSISKKLNKSKSLSIFRPCVESQHPQIQFPSKILKYFFFWFIRTFRVDKMCAIRISNSTGVGFFFPSKGNVLCNRDGREHSLCLQKFIQETI